ncbi:SMP-30/gluconolactonase/LRE family protein [Ramlibacter sp. AW1]|uniref:SMP-30/gluconolactonase/LRE family protein n=1 Tax=Ramlibacter aurantiacus TaxID=2801330 RepID=A0A937D7U0_9BURK|nr:SMP-30/gluconolactonase/LRE family protein [Ramlibacter aurantiacus]MBL0421311.1 SMP-30/gluconolactonase/LRE family protein [Ramlibacter aurantiacus]
MKILHWQRVGHQTHQVGESPFWHPDEHRLYWLDNEADQLWRSAGGHQRPESWAMPSSPGCIAPARSGGLVIALRDGIYRARQWGGPLQRLAPARHDPRSTRFNDGKADPQGRFWAGTIYEPRDRPDAALFCLDARPGRGPAASLRRVLGGVTNANGLAFAPDSRTLYWADTTRHLVRAWDFDAATGTPANERVFHRFGAKPPGWRAGQAGYGGRPDGAAIDAQGNYWCALFEGGRLLQLSPTGQVLQELPLPVRCPTMPCFGGPDLRTLFLTTASHKRPADELRRLPLSGHVLWTRVDVPGRPVDFFVD